MVSLLTVFKGLVDTKTTKSVGQLSQTCHKWVTSQSPPPQFPVLTVSCPPAVLPSEYKQQHVQSHPKAMPGSQLQTS